MKSLITALITTIFIISAQAQDITHQVKDKVCNVYKNPSRAGQIVKELEPKSWVKILRTYNEFYQIDGGYLHKDDILTSYYQYKIDSIKKEELLLEAIKIKNRIDSINLYLDLFDKSLGTNKLYVSHFFEKEYLSATFTFNIISKHKKKVKYVTIYVQPYNPVDDKIGNPLMFKAVGPISDDKEIHTYTFDNTINSNVLSYIKITKVLVQFMDNTKINLTSKDVTYTDKSLKLIEKLNTFSSN